MNIKASTRYQIWEYKKSVAVFYLVVILVMLTFNIFTLFSTGFRVNVDGGFTMSSIIFLFVAGLNSFKETFLMSVQNGVSRRTMFIGRIYSIGIMSTGMAVIDYILNIIFGFLENERYRMQDLYEQMFPVRASEVSAIVSVGESVLLMICLYFASTAVGYLITTAYYRMNKALKISVSVGVPVGLFLVLPIVDSGLTNGRISIALSKFVLFLTGVEKGHPYYMIGSSVVAAVLALGLSWLLMRRAVDKS